MSRKRKQNDDDEHECICPTMKGMKKYTVDSQIGAGTYGTVYKAKKTNKDVAIKVCLPSEDDGFIHKTTLIEYQLFSIHLLRRMPHIIPIQDIFVRSGSIHFVQDYRPYCLHDLLTKSGNEAVTRSLAPHIMHALLRMLRVFHRQKWMFRDLKSPHILFDRLPTCENVHDVKIDICDLGLVGFDEQKHKNRYNTDNYFCMSTRVNSNSYDCSIDFWAVGILLLECWFGISLHVDDMEEPINKQQFDSKILLLIDSIQNKQEKECFQMLLSEKSFTIDDLLSKNDWAKGCYHMKCNNLGCIEYIKNKGDDYDAYLTIVPRSRFAVSTTYPFQEWEKTIPKWVETWCASHDISPVMTRNYQLVVEKWRAYIKWINKHNLDHLQVYIIMMIQLIRKYSIHEKFMISMKDIVIETGFTLEQLRDIELRLWTSSRFPSHLIVFS